VASLESPSRGIVQLGVRLSLVAACAALASVVISAQNHWIGPLDSHPSIAYASTQPTDRAATLNEALASGAKTLQRDAQTGYLKSVLDAFDISIDSQLLVFSKTGVQATFTSPKSPRALYYDQSVVVGYIPTAPVIEIASDDAQQGVNFYVIDQRAEKPMLQRRTSCLSCHVSHSTLEVPGLIVRSHTVADDGTVMTGATDVTHATPHPDRWGGWYVTVDTLSQAYQQRAHAGNITTEGQGYTSNQIFTDWINSDPMSHGYLSALSDSVSLLAFDHQAHAVNLFTRLNWEARVDPASADVHRLVNELADYLLFVDEAAMSIPLTPRPGFAAHLAATTPKDRRGRSLAELNAETRLLKYPCSYMIYSPAFDGLPAPVKQAVYPRMIDILAGRDPQKKYARLSGSDRQAILDILADTKPDFHLTS